MEEKIVKTTPKIVTKVAPKIASKVAPTSTPGTTNIPEKPASCKKWAKWVHALFGIVIIALVWWKPAVLWAQATITVIAVLGMSHMLWKGKNCCNNLSGSWSDISYHVYDSRKYC